MTLRTAGFLAKLTVRAAIESGCGNLLWNHWCATRALERILFRRSTRKSDQERDKEETMKKALMWTASLSGAALLLSLLPDIKRYIKIATL